MTIHKLIVEDETISEKKPVLKFADCKITKFDVQKIHFQFSTLDS